MADLNPYYAALQKADAAGDTAGAKQLADYIRTQAVPAAATPSPSATDYAVGTGETALHLGTGLVAAPVAGLLGAGMGAINGIAKLTGQTPGPDAADVTNRVQNAMTYDPKTIAGQVLTKAATYLPGKFSQGANWAGEKTAELTGSPAAGTAVNTGIQALPLLLGAKLPVGKGVASTVAPEVAEATSAGLKLTPEQANSGIVGRTVQGLSGSAKLERSISKQNAPVVNQLGAQEIGAPNLTPKSIAEAKAPANAVYTRVSQLGDVPLDGFQSALDKVVSKGTLKNSDIEALKEHYGGMDSIDAADAVADIRQLRADAGKNVKAPFAPSQNALGHAQLKISNALEDQLDQHVQKLSATPDSGVPANLISQFRAARVQLAKIHSVQDAMDGPHLSAKDLAKQQDRGVPLSGNLRTLANAATNFDRSFQDVSKIRDSGPFGVLDLGFGAAAGLAHPVATAAVLARPLARAALASDAYQRAAIQGVKTAPSFPRLAGVGKSLPFVTSEQPPNSLASMTLESLNQQ